MLLIIMILWSTYFFKNLKPPALQWRYPIYHNKEEVRQNAFGTVYYEIVKFERKRFTRTGFLWKSESIEFKLKLKPIVCSLCWETIKIHRYYPRKLTHSTFANRKYTILYLEIYSIILQNSRI